MEQTALGLIPWNTQPQVPAQATHTITWNGGSFEIPRFGYLQASEHDFIAEIDPTNLGYSLTLEASVQLQKAIHDFDNWPPMRCYALLKLLIQHPMGTSLGLRQRRLRCCQCMRLLLMPTGKE